MSLCAPAWRDPPLRPLGACPSKSQRNVVARSLPKCTCSRRSWPCRTKEKPYCLELSRALEIPTAVCVCFARSIRVIIRRLPYDSDVCHCNSARAFAREMKTWHAMAFEAVMTIETSVIVNPLASRAWAGAAWFSAEALCRHFKFVGKSGQGVQCSATLAWEDIECFLFLKSTDDLARARICQTHDGRGLGQAKP